MKKRGAPVKYTQEKVEAIVALVASSGRTYKALALERHIPYVSLIAALKRYGLSPRRPVTPAAPVEHLAA